MNIWLIHLGELLPVDDSVRLFRYGILAEMLAERGHFVTRWAPTFVHAYKRQRCLQDKVIPITDRYRIALLYAKGYRRHIGIARWRFHMQVSRAFLRQAKLESSPDVILCAMPTPEMCVAAINYGKRQHVPVIIDVRDLWPDIYLDVFPNALRGIARVALRSLFRMNYYTFSQARAIVGISPAYLQWGLDYAGRDRSEWDRVFPMGYQRNSVESQERERIRRDWLDRGIDKDAFICCFFGTMGRQFDLETVIEAARYFLGNGDDAIQFVLCGDGVRFDYYKDLARDLDNVILPGWIDRTDIAVLMEWAQVGLAPYGRGAKMSLPNKPFEYFSGGLPVLSSLRGELEALLRANDCGITYEVGDVEGFITAVQHLRHNSTEREKMGRNAHELFEKRFSAKRIYSGMIDYLEDL